MVTVSAAQVVHAGFVRLGVDLDAHGHEGLEQQRAEQRAEQRPVSGDFGPSALPPQKGAGVDADELGGQSRVGQVVLGGLGQTAQMVAVRDPPGTGSSSQSWERTSR